MTERKTDILNLRLDPALAAEIDRIAAWRGKTASEAARDLLQYGIQAERGLQAEELKRPYGSTPVDRDANGVKVIVEARYRFFTVAEMERMREEFEAGEYHDSQHDVGI